MTCTNSLENRGVKEGYIFVATNQDVLLFKLLTFFGVLLFEACYCLQLYGILKNYIAPSEKIPSHYLPSPEIWCILFSYLKIIKLPPFYFHIRQNYPEQPSLDKAKVRILPSNCLGL